MRYHKVQVVVEAECDTRQFSAAYLKEQLRAAVVEGVNDSDALDGLNVTITLSSDVVASYEREGVK